MATSNFSQKVRLPILLSAGSCATIVAVSYHVINQRYLYGGFDRWPSSNGAGWTLPVISIALLSVLYFISALYTLFLDIRQSTGADLERHQRINLYIQGFLVCSLFVFSPESAGVFAAMCLTRLRHFHSLKTALYVLLFTVMIFACSLAFHYGTDLGLLGIVIVTVLVTGFYSFTLVHSHNAVAEKELRQRALKLNRELLATRELLAQSSRQSERLRISRNIHDLMGHQLTGLILNLEVASHISEGEARERVEQSLTLARNLLDDLRLAVGDLRESQFLDFRQAVGKVIANIPDLEIELSMEEGLLVGDVETVETFVRCLQESLTNVRRHANATRCSVAFYRANGEVVMRIADNGSVRDIIAPGNGLTGMLERVSGLSGKLHWGQSKGSFFLEAALPLKAS